ncbi:endonuclease/exonuclease/phosphatase family protein [Maribacter sp. 2304DJ31-5]|uniref:endonuclease/exonuclease/phosphatase family protein n=1 Tax=Maribacter sp. 2304DJ31-5 TaxID=3386273 RepID=UPI0039BD3DB3
MNFILTQERRYGIVFLMLFIAGVFSSLYAQTLEEEKKTIRVLSYNIHYGVGTDSEKDLQRIADVINELNPDIVGLQEVSDSVMVSKLAELTGMKGVFGASTEIEPPNLYRLLGIPVPESQLYYGDAILSKYPIEYIGNVSIPSASSSRYEAMCVDIDLSSWLGQEEKLRLINTHFDYLNTIGTKEARKASIEVIETAFFSEDMTLAILTGDLNVIPQSEPIRLLEEKGWMNENLGKELYTVPATDPIKQIDYILPRPKNRWKVVEVDVIQEPIASDHLPLLMDLELVSKK